MKFRVRVKLLVRVLFGVRIKFRVSVKFRKALDLIHCVWPIEFYRKLCDVPSTVKILPYASHSFLWNLLIFLRPWRFFVIFIALVLVRVRSWPSGYISYHLVLESRSTYFWPYSYYTIEPSSADSRSRPTMSGPMTHFCVKKCFRKICAIFRV